MKSLITSEKSLMDIVVNSAVPDREGDDRHLPDGFKLPELDDEKMSKFTDGAIDGIYIYHTAHQPISDEAKLTRVFLAGFFIAFPTRSMITSPHARIQPFSGTKASAGIASTWTVYPIITSVQ